MVATLHPSSMPPTGVRKRADGLRGVAVAVWLAMLTWLGVTMAQPLNPAFVYLLDAPVVEAGTPWLGMLDASSGQNFKDGSHHQVVLLATTPGVPMEVTVNADTFDAYLTIYAPDGTLIAAVDDGPVGLDPVTSFTPEQVGPHLLVVSGFGPRDLGMFEIRAERLVASEPVALTIPARVEGFLRGTEMPDPEVGLGSSQTYLLDLDTGGLIRIRARSQAFDTVLTLFDADGFLDENDDTSTSIDSELLLEVPAGRYRIVVSAWGEGSGPFSLDVDRFVAVQ